MNWCVLRDGVNIDVFYWLVNVDVFYGVVCFTGCFTGWKIMICFMGWYGMRSIMTAPHLELTTPAPTRLPPEHHRDRGSLSGEKYKM